MEKTKLNKIPIMEAKIKGGFKEGLEQLYRINLMPEEVIEGETFCDKIELAILLVEGERNYAYRSLRFTQPVQLMSFIIGLVKAYFLFSRKKGIINPNNFNYHLTKFFEKLQKGIRE